MNAQQINPFIEATCQVFQTMLQCEPSRGKMRVADQPNEQGGLTALISLSGDMRGAVAVTFPVETARSVAQRLAQTEDDIENEELIDALGEVANMISGCAKAKFDGMDITIGLPTVVRGETFCLDHPKNSVTLVVPFTSELGAFKLNVTFSKLS